MNVVSAERSDARAKTHVRLLPNGISAHPFFIDDCALSGLQNLRIDEFNIFVPFPSRSALSLMLTLIPSPHSQQRLDLYEGLR